MSERAITFLSGCQSSLGGLPECRLLVWYLAPDGQVFDGGSELRRASVIRNTTHTTRAGSRVLAKRNAHSTHQLIHNCTNHLINRTEPRPSTADCRSRKSKEGTNERWQQQIQKPFPEASPKCFTTAKVLLSTRARSSNCSLSLCASASR